MNVFKFLVVSFLIYAPLFATGQTPLEKAKSYLENRQYRLAINTLNNRNVLKNPSAQFLIAVSYFETNQLDQATRYLNPLLEEDENLFPEAWWYKAQILHAQNEYEEALIWYKGYLKQLRDNHPQRNIVRNTIRACSNGTTLKFKPSYTVVENLGRGVNSEFDEFRPIPSPNRQNKIYFSSIRPANTGGLRDRFGNRDDVFGKAKADMYGVEQVNGMWDNAEGLGYRLNSNENEVIMDFNGQGNALYYFKGHNLSQGYIYIDSFQTVNNTISTTPLSTPFDSQLGDVDPFLAHDTVIYFASNRPGGFGGYDIYKTTNQYGFWSEPINLGSDVNTPFDERSPYLCNDQRTLYFSTSDPAISIGGLDIVKTVYIPQKDRWIPRENAGIPINSSGDDSHFRIGKDGYSAFFDSSRKDGYGQRDLYIAFFDSYLVENENPSTPQFVTNNNSTSLSNDPLDEEISSLNYTDQETQQLPANWISQLEIPVHSIDYDLQLNMVNQLVDLLTQFPETKLIISSNVLEVPLLQRELNEGLNRAGQVADWFILRGIAPGRLFLRSIATDNPEAVVLSFFNPQSFGDPRIVTIENLASSLYFSRSNFFSSIYYQIQVASTNKPSTNKKLASYADLMVEKSEDGRFRYSLGAYANYANALDQLGQVRSRIQKDAYIVPYIQGLRIDKQMAQELSTQYPDLQNYLNN